MVIFWTHEAFEKLIEIEDFIANDSPERAASFVDEIIKHTETLLTDKPLVGRIVTEISNPDVRELIFNKYRIIYRVNKNKIEILTVFEGHRLLPIDDILL